MKEYKIDQNTISNVIFLMNNGAFGTVNYQQLKEIEKKLATLPEIKSGNDKDKKETK